MLLLSLILAIMISFAEKNQATHYGRMFGVSYWMRLVSFGNQLPNEYHFFTGERVYDEDTGREVGSVYLGSIEVSQEEMKHMKYQMQVRSRAWKKFKESDMPLRKSWWD